MSKRKATMYWIGDRRPRFLGKIDEIFKTDVPMHYIKIAHPQYTNIRGPFRTKKAAEKAR